MSYGVRPFQILFSQHGQTSPPSGKLIRDLHQIQNPGYDEIYQIEYVKTGLFENDDPDVTGKGKTLEVANGVLRVVACFVAATGGAGC